MWDGPRKEHGELDSSVASENALLGPIPRSDFSTTCYTVTASVLHRVFLLFLALQWLLCYHCQLMCEILSDGSPTILAHELRRCEPLVVATNTHTWLLGTVTFGLGVRVNTASLD